MIEDILPRLDKVRRTGPINWIASCPAHEDRNPSLTLKQESDGQVLARCHSGCDFHAIVGAVGVGYGPWFAEKDPRELALAPKRPFPAGDVLEALADEAFLVAVCAANMANGVVLTEEDKQRLLVASRRISYAMELALGRR